LIAVFEGKGSCISKQFKKRQKKAVATPKVGIWRIFRYCARIGSQLKKFKKACQKEKYLPIVTAIFKSMLPAPERIETFDIYMAPKPRKHGEDMFRVLITCAPERRITFTFTQGTPCIRVEFYDATLNVSYNEFGLYFIYNGRDIFHELRIHWDHCLFQKPDDGRRYVPWNYNFYQWMR
jgi:hypothetical protein